MNSADAIRQVALETPNSASILIDDKGTIQYVSETYKKIAQMSEHELIGRSIAELPWETQTMGVLESGRPMVGYHWIVNGRTGGLASSYPIFREGRLSGCFTYTIFLNIWGAEGMMKNLLAELDIYKDEISLAYAPNFGFEDIIGQSPAIEMIKHLAQEVATHVGTSVLIQGESGTGKELFANAIHKCSRRANLPFVRVNCAAIPENLLESELFGYEEGSFTGAKKGGKPGKFEIANHGTIFLDEIGEMSLPMQSKLLVAVQERTIERLGDSQPRKINVRIVAATNADLEKMVRKGLFREDLYYRLNVVTIKIPPLRSRIEDIPLLSHHFLAKLNHKLDLAVLDITPQAMDVLQKYSWPGNVRELENTLERAVILADMNQEHAVRPEHLNISTARSASLGPSNTRSLRSLRKEFEKRILAHVLEKNHYDKKLTAEQLQIDKSQLYRKIKEYGIRSFDWEGSDQ